jgi:hypothetical protein
MLPGTFVVGCNYWASHAGAAMWSNWHADIVERDFHRLSEAGLQVLRVFPLWPDFQPLQRLYGGEGKPVEFRFGEAPLPDNDIGRAGVSETALQRFDVLVDLAQRYQLQLIVGLITGWMSGRLFVPPALEGRNILTDPLALMWQVRLVQCLVRRFKDSPTIAAWDLGNECNVLAEAPSREAAWLWTATIVNAIRAIDTGRPVISGMHSLRPTGEWTTQDQGELTDLLTTHPYPLWTPYAAQDPINTIRPLLHATSESRMYSDIGGQPCMVEEIGTMGTMMASDDVAADFLRTNLFSLWAHDCRALLWWCAFDQTRLESAPYDWNAVERELGLLRADGAPKPVVDEIQRFRAFLSQFSCGPLPPYRRDAVCILSEDQDHWGVAYSAFVLSKQAGIDITFQYADQPLKAASLYLLPSICGHRVLHRRRWQALLAQVAAGATLYISMHDGFISDFEAITGARVITRSHRSQPTELIFTSTIDAPAMSIAGPIQLTIRATRATVLGAEATGNPLFTRAAYGQGQVYFLGLPLELDLTHRPGVFQPPTSLPYWQIYQQISGAARARRVVAKTTPNLGITEHAIDDDTRFVVFINYTPEALHTSVQLAQPWRLATALYNHAEARRDQQVSLSIPHNDAAVVACTRA